MSDLWQRHPDWSRAERALDRPHTCPTCGAAFDAFDGLALTTSERAVAEIIRRAGRSGITAAQIADRLYADRPDGGPLSSRNCVHRFVQGLKAKIAGTGHAIVCHGHYYHVESE
jgi:hypothetical protein